MSFAWFSAIGLSWSLLAFPGLSCIPEIFKLVTKRQDHAQKWLSSDRLLSSDLSWALSLSLQTWDPSYSVSVWDSRSPRLSHGYQPHFHRQQYGWASVSCLISLLLCSWGLRPFPWSQTSTLSVYFPSVKTEISTLILPFEKRRTIYQEMNEVQCLSWPQRVMLHKSIAALSNSRRNRPPWSLSINLSDHSDVLNTEVLKGD